MPLSSLPGKDSQAVIRRCQYSRPGTGRGMEKGSQTRRRGRELHSRRGIQTPEVPGAAGTEPEQRPRPGNDTTQPDIQAEAHGADPSRRRHCRRRRPPSGTALKGSPEGRVRVAGIVHTAVWDYARRAEREAAGVPDRGRLVRLQPGSEPSPDVTAQPPGEREWGTPKATIQGWARSPWKKPVPFAYR